jgi:hypothetical protein
MISPALARAEAHVTTSIALVAEARAIRRTALWLKVHAQQVRGARVLHGASDDDAASVLSLILERTLCTACVARKTGLLASRIDDLLIRLGHTVHSRIAIGRCEECLKETVVYRVG